VPRRRVLSAAALALVLPACESSKPGRASPSFRATSLAEAPEPFREMKAILKEVAGHRDRRDAAPIRGLAERVLARSKALLLMPPPADLKRDVVPRFLEGRASFGDAVNAFDRALGSRDDALLFSATEDLERAFWAWHDAYREVPSEGAV
jgi:hypothetical protein